MIMPRLQRLVRSDGSEIAVNPAQVRMVWVPDDNSGFVRIAFDDRHTVDVKGGIRRVEELLGDSLNSD